MSAPPLSSRNWGTAKVLKNLYWESTIPRSLAPGSYLVRHELLALHQANTPQFYAECAQVRRRFFFLLLWLRIVLEVCCVVVC